MSIRPLVAADLERVLDLWEALMANGHDADPRWEPAPGARGVVSDWAAAVWPRPDPFHHGWVAEEEGHIAGFLAGIPRMALPVLTAPPVARITDLYVEPRARGRGLGRALVEAFSSEASDAGYPMLEASTLTFDSRAIGFWRAMGLAEMQVVLARMADPS